RAAASVGGQTDKRNCCGCCHHKNFPHIILSILTFKLRPLKPSAIPAYASFRLLAAAFGAPDRIRTCDLCLRRATLYPTELRVPRRPNLAKGSIRSNGRAA